MQVLQSCARYAETRLRFLAKEGQIEDKTEVLAVAQIKYLQEEFGQLNVAKGFGEDTFNVFRMLRRHTNYFASPGVHKQQSHLRLNVVVTLVVAAVVTVIGAEVMHILCIFV